MINSGIGGDTAVGALERLERDVFSHKGVSVMIGDEVVALFDAYVTVDKHQAVIKLLEVCLNHEQTLTDKEKCWAIWNISDRFAMLRKAHQLLLNHKRFEKQLLNMEPKYLHWIVSDGTQKLTLIVGGYEKYWNNLYKYACENCPKINENAIIRFESHRASVPIPMAVEYKADKNHAMFSLENLKSTLKELKGSSNELFYELTYYTQIFACYNFFKENFKPFLDPANESFKKLLPYLNTDNHAAYADGKHHLLGSWDQLNQPRSPYNQATCAIHNYIIQLINAKEFKLALQCYDKIKIFDLNYGRYFDSKIEFAKKSV